MPLWAVDALQRLLDDPTPVHLESEVEHVTLDQPDQLALLRVRPVLEELLDHVVPEHV